MSKKYSFDDHPEHKELLNVYADKWIKNAMSTKAMDQAEREKCIDAVERLYRAADLKPPPRERIIFVPSPFVGRVAAGLASAVWYCRKNKGFDPANVTNAATRNATNAATVDATRIATRNATNAATRIATSNATVDATVDATDDATWVATSDATSNATWIATEDATSNATVDATVDATDDATWVATSDATSNATWIATEDATRDATWNATVDATDDATNDATWIATVDATVDATDDATVDATLNATNAATWNATDPNAYYTFNPEIISILAKQFGVNELGIGCCKDAWRLYNGGNQYSGWCSYLSFFREVAKLDVDYSKYDAYETLALHSGPRYMHEEFCIISDRPEIITVNEQNQPHNEAGPFTKWRDGSAIYALNGVYMPRWLFETPKDKIEPSDILKISNVEQRREAIKWYGLENLLNYMNYRVIDTRDDYNYAVIKLDLGDGETGTFLKMDNPSVKGEIHVEGVGDHVTTVAEALQDRWPTNMLKKYGYQEALERA